MTEEVFSEVKKTIIDRLKNPLIFSFIVSLIAYNWRSISIFIFLNVSIIEKIEIVSQYTDLCKLLIYPSITAIIYVLVIPYLSAFIGRLLIKQKDMLHDTNSDEDFNNKMKEKADLTHRIELEQLEVSLRSKTNQKETIDNYIKEIKIRDEQIEQLNSLLNEAQDRYEDIVKENESNKQKNYKISEKIILKGDKVFIKEYKGGNLFYYDFKENVYIHPLDFE